jgi:hypothetical protein
MLLRLLWAPEVPSTAAMQARKRYDLGVPSIPSGSFPARRSLSHCTASYRLSAALRSAALARIDPLGRKRSAYSRSASSRRARRSACHHAPGSTSAAAPNVKPSDAWSRYCCSAPASQTPSAPTSPVPSRTTNLRIASMRFAGDFVARSTRLKLGNFRSSARSPTRQGFRCAYRAL